MDIGNLIGLILCFVRLFRCSICRLCRRWLLVSFTAVDSDIFALPLLASLFLPRLQTWPSSTIVTLYCSSGRPSMELVECKISPRCSTESGATIDLLDLERALRLSGAGEMIEVPPGPLGLVRSSRLITFFSGAPFDDRSGTGSTSPRSCRFHCRRLRSLCLSAG